MSAKAPGTGGGLVWLVLSRGGAVVRSDAQVAGDPPCVYIIPENDSPHDSEAMDMHPRFKLMSADLAVLTGPQKDPKEPGKDTPEYRGGSCATTMNSEDGRDYLEAYPAPVDEQFTNAHFNCYLWSPTRGAALVVSRAGRVEWDAKVQPRTVLQFGVSPSLTVWTVKRAAAKGEALGGPGGPPEEGLGGPATPAPPAPPGKEGLEAHWRNNVLCDGKTIGKFNVLRSRLACAEACEKDPNCKYAAQRRVAGIDLAECRIKAECGKGGLAESSGWNTWVKPSGSGGVPTGPPAVPGNPLEAHWRNGVLCDGKTIGKFNVLRSRLACAEACQKDPKCKYAAQRRVAGIDMAECRIKADCGKGGLAASSGWNTWVKPS